VVEVHGLPDSAGRIVATHVEREAASEAAYIAGGGEYRLRGPVVGLLSSSSGSTFAVRGVAIRTDGATQFDGTPVEGSSVSVRLNPTLQSDGRYLAQRVKLRSASYDDLPSTAEAEIEGYVSGFDASAGTLTVAGYAVRLASNVAYEDGIAADLKNGVRIEAKGSVDNGVLVAAVIKFESHDDNGDGNDDEVSGGLRIRVQGLGHLHQVRASSSFSSVKGRDRDLRHAHRVRRRPGGTTLNSSMVESRPWLGQARTAVYRATNPLDD
jgi:hypothetical protein